MPNLVPIPLPRQSYKAESSSAIGTRLLNMYAEPNPEGAKNPYSIYSRPGLKLWLSVGDGPIRGIHEMSGALWVVSGETLYRVGSQKKIDTIGRVDGSGRVRMTSNYTHVVIATRAKAYVADLQGVEQLVEANLNGVAYVDGYGIYSQAGGEVFWISGLDDLTTISALDFSSADAYADKVMGLIDDHREVLVFGERTVEAYYNSGNSTFPFQRNQGGFIEIGCLSGGSIAKINNIVFWLGHDLNVYAMSGYTPRVISNQGVARIISELPSPNSCEAYTYSYMGHDFYVMTWPTRTLVYCLKTGLWHEEESRGHNGRLLASCHVYFNRLNLVGDYSSGNIYEIDKDTYTDNGEEIEREAITDPIFPKSSRGILHELMIDVEAGNSITTGQGSDSLIDIRQSDDGGHLWGCLQSRSVGKIGERRHRVLYARLGAFYERHIKIRYSEPTKFVINGLYGRFEQLS